jgi:hypothetical protein
MYLGLEKVGENAQVLWNDGGQDGVEPPTPASSETALLSIYNALRAAEDCLGTL